MDLSHIQEKCRSNKYRSRIEFLDDFRQIAFNALLYNGYTHGIYEKAAELRDAAVEVVNRRVGELAPSEKALETYIAPETEDQTPEAEKDAKRVARHKALQQQGGPAPAQAQAPAPALAPTSAAPAAL